VIDLRAVLIDRDELLVQVLERGAGRAQPVLEHGDVRVRLRRLDLGERAHGEGEVCGMLVGVNVPDEASSIVGRRTVDEVPARDDDVVRSAEEVECRLFEETSSPLAARADLGELGDVRPARGSTDTPAPTRRPAGWRKPWFSRQYSADTISKRLPNRRNSATVSKRCAAGRDAAR
jgi:hypothetical protein